MRKLHPDRRSEATVWRAALVLAAGLAMTGGGLGQASAQSRATDESALKAAFVYNFAKYTDWPDDVWNRSPKLRLCTAVERGGFTQTVAALEGKPAVRGKEVDVRQLSRPEEAASCHILVIAGRAKMADWTRGVRLLPVLTVGDGEGFATNAGLIGFYAEGEKLKFEVNQEAAHRAGLRLSSQLLKLARLVRDEQGEGR